MNVAVPSAQHSKMLGQPASSQTVTSSSDRIVFLSAAVLRAHVRLDPQPLGLALGDLERLGGTGVVALPGHVGPLPAAAAPSLGGEASDGVDDLAHRRRRTPSAASEVTALSAMPHGTMRSNNARSGSTLRAKPCIERPLLTRTPMAQILRPLDPHAGVAVEPRRAGQAEVGERVDDELLDGVHVTGVALGPTGRRRSDSRRAGRARGR